MVVCICATITSVATCSLWMMCTMVNSDRSMNVINFADGRICCTSFLCLSHEIFLTAVPYQNMMVGISMYPRSSSEVCYLYNVSLPVKKKRNFILGQFLDLPPWYCARPSSYYAFLFLHYCIIHCLGLHLLL